LNGCVRSRMLSEMASAIRKYFDVRVEKDLVCITTIVTKFPITPNTRHVGNKNMLMYFKALRTSSYMVCSDGTGTVVVFAHDVLHVQL